MNAGLWVGIAYSTKFVSDLLSRFNQFGFAPRTQQYAGPGDGKVSTQLETDAQAAAGDHCRLAFVQAWKHPHQRRGHGTFTSGALDVLWNPQVYRIHLADTVGQSSRPVGCKGQCVPVFCVVTNQLIGLNSPLQLTRSFQGVVLVTPATNQCLV